MGGRGDGTAPLGREGDLKPVGGGSGAGDPSWRGGGGGSAAYGRAKGDSCRPDVDGAWQTLTSGQGGLEQAGWQPRA